jgi:hypothetical protein
MSAKLLDVLDHQLPLVADAVLASVRAAWEVYEAKGTLLISAAELKRAIRAQVERQLDFKNRTGSVKDVVEALNSLW